MTPDEIEQFDAMPMELAANQILMESLSAMRLFNRLVGELSPEMKALATMTEGDRWGYLRSLSDSTRLESDAANAIASVNQFRATLARFVEIAETKVDKTGLLEIPDGMTFDESQSRIAVVERIAAEKLSREFD